jgi:hypothetical protein
MLVNFRKNIDGGEKRAWSMQKAARYVEAQGVFCALHTRMK